VIYTCTVFHYRCRSLNWQGNARTHLKQVYTSTARACQATVGHAPIGEYQLRFHPGEPMSCRCPPWPLETRDHNLCMCQRAHHEEDREPPFSPIEVLEFCKLNVWVFAFPPPWMGGNLIEWWVWCHLASRRPAWGWDSHCVAAKWGGLWSSWTFMVKWHHLAVGQETCSVGHHGAAVFGLRSWLPSALVGVVVK